MSSSNNSNKCFPHGEPHSRRTQRRRRRHSDESDSEELEHRRQHALEERFRRDPSYRSQYQLWRSLLALKNNACITSWTSELNPETTDPDYIILLGEALMTNTVLRRLELRRLALTEADAYALVRGINFSRLESVALTLHSSPDKPLAEIWNILCQGLRSPTVQEMQLQSMPWVEIAGLGMLLSSLPSLRKLRLESLILFDEQRARSLAKGLRESKLECLFVSQPYIPDPAQRQSKLHDTIWKILIHDGIKSIQSLDELIFQRASTDQVIELSNGFHGMKSLRKLGLEYTNLSETSATALAKGIIRQSKLESLSFKQHPTEVCSGLYGQVLLEILPSSTSLTKLELLNLPLENNAIFITLLAKGICQNSSVQSLVLGGLGINAPWIQILFEQGLQHNGTLTKLAFHQCPFDVNMILSMEKHWPLNSPISTLCLHTTTINHCGIQALFGIVSRHPALKELELNGMTHLGYESLSMIGKGLVHQPYLTSITLCGCSTGERHDVAVHARAHATARCLAVQALLEGIQKNLRLQHVNVRGNSFPPKVERAIEFRAGINRMGRYLLTTNHGLATSIWCFILAKCQQQRELAASLTYYHLHEQPHLMRYFGSVT